MPIDPVRLRARATEAASQLVNPSRCAAALRQILADHADRAHRYSPRLADSTLLNQHRTPAPVIRAIVAALRRPAAASLDEALALARALWAAGSREERRVAAEVLGLVAARAPAEVEAQVQAWLPEADSGETVDALAQQALRPLLAGDAYHYLQRAQRWALQPDRWTRRFGVALLSALARDRRWDDVPAALDILRGLMTERDPLVRQAVIAALHDLAPRDPAGVERFLREQAGRPDHNTHLIVRAALRVLPAEARDDLVRAMRA